MVPSGSTPSRCSARTPSTHALSKRCSLGALPLPALERDPLRLAATAPTLSTRVAKKENGTGLAYSDAGGGGGGRAIAGRIHACAP